MTALGIAFCVGGSVKWLCGGPGAGWLYVRPDLAEQLEPAFAGWQGARRAVRVRGGDGARARRRALPHRHAGRRRELRGERGLRDHQGDRRRADPRELDATDGAPRRARRRRRLRADLAARARAIRGGPSSSACPTSRPCTRSSRPARSSATTGPTRACASARTSSRPTTRSALRSTRSRRSSLPARTRRAPGAAAGY